MGFEMPEFQDDIKQTVNLSRYAWNVIKDDIKNFAKDTDPINTSGFLNKIFKNYWNDARASINNSLRSKKIELEEQYNQKCFKNIDSKSKRLLIEETLKLYRSELEAEVSKNIKKKGESIKLRVNKENTITLVNDCNDEYNELYGGDGKTIKGTPKNYLKSIFEEYALLPEYVRERIYFKEIVDEVKKAAHDGHGLRILLSKRTAKSGKSYRPKFYVTLYKEPLLIDKYRMHNYIVGYSQKATDDGSESIPEIASFRISKIDSINIQKNTRSITKAIEQQIEEALLNQGVNYLTGKIETFKVRFTNKGLADFNAIEYLRPTNFEVDPEDDHVYIFKCPVAQFRHYFPKFI